MNVAWSDLAAAFGLLLVFEGLLPFANPAGVRRAMATLVTLADRQLRIAGLASITAGLLLLWFVRSSGG
ncbi:MAG: DUF2065 domain-containing protein [Gammaproteobacteria bacterium]|nr:MAG: DUF2065 domain-containing protein [Gammaproteobacteria bacterium]